jgi:hypothetical protein
VLRRALAILAAAAVPGCGPGPSGGNLADTVQIEVLPKPGLCEVQGVPLNCDTAAVYLRDTLRVEVSRPVAIVWKGGVPPDGARLSAVARSATAAGFGSVGFVSISKFTNARTGEAPPANDESAAESP